MKESKYKSGYEKFMYVWAIVSPIWLLLQAIQIFQHKNASGVSLPAHIIVLIGSILWIIYAVWALQKRNFVIVSNASLSGLLSIVVIIGKCLY